MDGKYTEAKGLYTFGVISGVKLKKFDRVVGKTVHKDPVLQYDNDPVKSECIYSYRVHAAAQGQSGGGGDSLVMPHAHSQDRFSEGELQHQLVFGVS